VSSEDLRIARFNITEALADNGGNPHLRPVLLALNAIMRHLEDVESGK
jgi:hypothetical protein